MKYIAVNSKEMVDSFPIALVVSRFNESITQRLQAGTLQRLNERGIHSKHILIIEVPGAIEIPFIVKRLAKKQQVKVIIALGAVIRGETSHYEYVCEQVSQGCQRIALEYDTPVIFGILTTENETQAWERIGGVHGHKGFDAADAAIALYQITNQLDALLQ